jgi:hypothetical protein
VSSDYAKKLAGRALDSLQELTKHRAPVTKNRRRKDGLRYHERRLEIRTATEIPGESPGADEGDGGESP